MRKHARRHTALASFLLSFLLIPGGHALGSDRDNISTATIHVDSDAKAISPDLLGIFFEDINYAADGGLYAELVQNRSFEYSVEDNRVWNSLTAWSIVNQDDLNTAVKVDTANPLNENNPHYLVLDAQREGDVVSLRNEGFDGIPLVGGDHYTVSLFARHLSGTPKSITIRLERVTGESLCEIHFDQLSDQWTKHAGKLVPSIDDANARLVVSASGPGSIAIDMVSLFPQKTFKNRPNGLRRDLAQVIADLKPRFIRFPGGCVAHGDGLENMYRWKNTIGPVEQRKAQRNIWRYHQTLGLGYFEYFQFCEDIGAKPLPVVPAGVSCQNSGNYLNLVPKGQRGIPMPQMADYVQEVLDLIEYANGPATSEWGAKRAEAGHPQPFGLEYLGVGNEDEITPAFKERFEMIRAAIQAKHPEITVIGTTGPGTDGRDYDEGWKFADAIDLEMVDEHGYKTPQWFWENLQRFDHYDRDLSQVYLGEYAAHDNRRANTLRSALSEAAYLTALERNGDHVRLSSYAPLLSKQGRTQWRPDLIYFDNVSCTPSINYHVQRLFSIHGGDQYLPTTISRQQESDDSRSHRDGIQLGTWNSHAQFDDVRITRTDTIIRQDSFEVLSPEWNQTSGQWNVEDGTLLQSSDQQPAIIKYPFPADPTGYTLTLRALKPSGAEGFLIGFATTGDNEYLWWNLGGWGNTQHAVELFRGGGSSILGSLVQGTIESNRWYDIKIELTKDRIRCYLDSKLVHDITHAFTGATPQLAASCVRVSTSGDTILKIVSNASKPVSVTVDWSSVITEHRKATRTVLAGDANSENRHGEPPQVLPETTKVSIVPRFDIKLPANSLTVFRMGTP